MGASGASTIMVKGKEGSNKMTYTYLFRGWAGPLVAFPASICARMLGRGEVKAKGVLAPEGAFDPKKFFTELTEKGFHFWEEKSVVRAIKP